MHQNTSFTTAPEATDTKGHEINTQLHHTIEINLPYRMITKRSQVQNEAYNSILFYFYKFQK